MIKRIYQIADVHIPTYQRLDVYAVQLEKLVQSIAEDARKAEVDQDEIRIVICGDLVQSKNMVTNELNVFASTFIRQLSEIGRVVCIAGNHDMIDGSSTRTDTLSAIFQTAQFDNAYFLDMEMEYSSGVQYDENVTWVLYSYFDEFACPEVELAKEERPGNTVIGLFHGSIVGSKLYNGFICDTGCDSEVFKGCDMVMAGHIHKRQELKIGNCPIVYSGSVIQQNFGESLTQHGYCVWNLTNNTHNFIDIESDFGYYNFKISSLDELKEDKEVLTNY